MWRAALPPVSAVRAFRDSRGALGLTPLVIHDGYLINLASPDASVRRNSIAAFRGELARAILLEADYLVMHPGTGRGQSLEDAIAALTAALMEAAHGIASQTLTLLFENTAGGGATLGRTFEELRAIRNAVSGRLEFATGYCLDTCHLYASGYDLGSAHGFAATVTAADSLLGLEHVPVIHANDSQGALGSRLDRHANIGDGNIGLDGFQRILQHRGLRDKSFILETPMKEEGAAARDISTLHSLCALPLLSPS